MKISLAILLLAAPAVSGRKLLRTKRRAAVLKVDSAMEDFVQISEKDLARALMGEMSMSMSMSMDAASGGGDSGGTSGGGTSGGGGTDGGDGGGSTDGGDGSGTGGGGDGSGTETSGSPTEPGRQSPDGGDPGSSTGEPSAAHSTRHLGLAAAAAMAVVPLLL
jgi:hypothetical protein